MRIAFIGDIVGRPGRTMIKHHTQYMKKEYKIDCVIANIENASHGFGLSNKNAKELFSYGVDIMTSGNHIWDKKDIMDLMQEFPKYPILRPINYPEDTIGSGLLKTKIDGENIAIINAMGMFSMPYTSNPFTLLKSKVAELRNDGYKNIFIDFHAEATSEKRALIMMLCSQVSGIIGTHTHIGTDDLEIYKNTAYATDIGLTGCFDNIIGLDEKKPIERFLTAMPIKYDINNNCRKIMQVIVMDFSDGICTNAFKIKAFNESREYLEAKALNFGL
ncbi:Phosphoesterase family protein [hydrothermal vent metagenome]|uniref:Phosphoesterase family protein n=1 Tax=hydrothermal vent metagenome TaxID=652676 RepID=A0A3B1E5F5_9ZZZZ